METPQMKYKFGKDRRGSRAMKSIAVLGLGKVGRLAAQRLM